MILLTMYEVLHISNNLYFHVLIVYNHGTNPTPPGVQYSKFSSTCYIASRVTHTFQEVTSGRRTHYGYQPCLWHFCQS